MTSMSERLANLPPQKLALLKKAMGNSQSVSEPIAVVGMGCRFAGTESVAEYWRVISGAVDNTGEIPKSRWDVDQFFDSKGGSPGKMTTRWGGFLENIDRFDASFFGVSPREAEKMDPQHRLLLEVVWEALEYGGIAPARLRESHTGVFVGVGGVDYSRIPVQLDNYYEQITAYSGTGNALSIAANRISYTLDLRGPSLSIDTACSSSLVAAHLAIRSLRSRECDMAIVGGVNAILTPETTLAFSQAQMLSPDGKCRPFDHRANGYVRGEGCGAIVLKRLSDATSDQDQILAVIRGSAVNQDGLTSGIAAPRGTSQIAVIQNALRDAGLRPSDISYIEAHGTATPLGDPIEVNALTEVFRKPKTPTGEESGPCYFGSVKANIGHTETAAGMASLIKTILMLRHQLIPQQVHFEELNPHIHLSPSRLRVADRHMPWSNNGKSRVAGVSSFGFGGTNSHIVLEEFVTKPAESPAVDRPKHILTLSAKSPEGLRELSSKYVQSIELAGTTTSLPDMCFTAAVGRSHFSHRLAVIANNLGELSKSLTDFLDGTNSKTILSAKARGDRRQKVAFLFPGQGAQFPQMGRELYKTHPVFRDALDHCDALLSGLLPHRLLDVLFEESSANGHVASNGQQHYKIHDTLYTQPVLFSVEYALSRLWRSFGITPTVVAGHSVGDYVAACDAGVFSLEDGLRLISSRAKLVASLPRDGLMAAVMAPRSQVADWIMPYASDVSVAVHNGHENTVISGRSEVVTELLEQFQISGVQSRVLEVSHAMHSPLLDPILDEFESVASEIKFTKPQGRWISSSDGKLEDDRVCSPKYWRDHLRNTVCYVDSVQTLRDMEIDAAIEIGPGTTLCSLSSRIIDAATLLLLPSIRSSQPDWDVILNSVAQLYVHGATIDWAGFDSPYQRKRQVLPTYPFERQSHWYDMSRKVSGTPVIKSGGRSVHPLLGVRLPMAGDKVVYEALLGTHNPTFLADHRVDKNPVFPAAAYAEQGLAVAKELFGPGQHAVTDLSIQQALVFNENQSRLVQVQVGPDQRGERTFDVFSHAVSASEDDAITWTHHATGNLRKQKELLTSNGGTDPLDLPATEARLPHSIESPVFYQRMASVGLQYGPSFAVLDVLKGQAGECLARMAIPQSISKELQAYTLHPAILDGCLQSMAVAINGLDEADGNDLILPTLIQSTVIKGKISGDSFWVHTQLREKEKTSGTYTADIRLFDPNGNCIAVVDGARVQRLAKQRSAGASSKSLVYSCDWVEPTSDPSLDSAVSQTNGKQVLGRWLLLADSVGIAHAVATSLVQRGDSVYLANDGEVFGTTVASGIAGLKGSFQLHPTSIADYEKLLASISQAQDATVTVVDLRCIGDRDQDAQDKLAIDAAGRTLMTLRALSKNKTVRVEKTWLVTSLAQQVQLNDPVNASQAVVWGMVRSAMVEMPQLSLRLVDLDNCETREGLGTMVSRLTAELIQQTSAHGDGEDHVALRSDKRLVARLRKSDRLSETGTSGKELAVPSSGRFQLRAGVAGGIEGLRYASMKPRELAPHDVEIEVGSTGLNFSDVLKAMGLYPGVKDEIVPLGIECAGIVTNKGDAVTDFQIGQRVMGVAPYSFASHTTTADYAIVATPENLSDEQAATIPITFLTAYHALVKLARLAPGDKLLIHAGAGGVGQAAIQIAQEIGAEIFTTAGSDEKREFLRDLGVKHVFDSRTLEFADQVLQITDGQGVDVVLNSLPGEAITKSLSILSAYGRFLEIGKTDIYQNRKIGLWPFQDNLSYSAIDLDRMLRQRPAEIRRLYAEVMPKFASRTYQPLPLNSFAQDKVIDAFRFMVQRRNIGKVVVSYAKSVAASTDGGPSESTHNVHGTVLITGGLGALGQKVARWAVAGGATHIVILTRQNPESVDHQAAPLRESGATVAIIQGDVAVRDSLASALASIPASFPSICGVVHAAGALRDGLMHTMDGEQLLAAMAPKVQGAWNLHKLIDTPLDFFVMFSSIAGAIGSPGQANYAAGNAFLDGMAAAMRNRGTNAISIAWGPWAAAGMAADEEIRSQLADRGMSPLDPEGAIALMDVAVRQRCGNVTITDTDWGKLLDKLPGGGSTLLMEFRSHENRSGREQRRPADQQLLNKLEAAKPGARLEILQDVIATTLAEVMGIDSSSIDSEQPLASLGLDSLMGMELRTGLESKLGFEIPMSSLLDDPSVASLANVANEMLSPNANSACKTNDADAVRKLEQGSTRSKKSAHANRRSDLVTLGGVDSALPPLFCVHPVGGDLRCYDGFARATRSRLVYGLRAHGLQAGSTPHTVFEQMIEDYILAIRNVRPNGPYCLMGWSTGGIFAYEIANRLLQQSLPVKPLIMVDTPLPSVFEKVDLNDNAKFLVDLIEFANYFAGTTMEVTYPDLRNQSENDALDCVLKLAIEHNVLPAQTTPAHLKRLVDVCRWHVGFLQSYIPPALDFAAHLIRPEDTSILSEAARQQHTDDFGWGQLVDLRMQRVSGHHFTMMTGHNAGAIAKVIDDLLLEDHSPSGVQDANSQLPIRPTTSGLEE